jgi:hypothetical protein
MLLCDYAEELNGKLYIMGGGWTKYPAGSAPPMAVAIKLAVEWAEFATDHKFELLLSAADDMDLRPFEVQGRAVTVEGTVGGRPDYAELHPDIPVDIAFALKFRSLNLSPGRYQWVLRIDDEPLTSVRFVVLPGPEEGAEDATEDRSSLPQSDAEQ